MAWGTSVDPADVICHLSVDGEPVPKGRPRMMVDKAGHPRVFTPPRTRQAEEDFGWALRAARRGHEPVPHPVGVLAFFRTRHGRADADNLIKMCLDSANGILFTDDQQVSELHVHVARHCTEPGTDLLVWLTRRRGPHDLDSRIQSEEEV